MSLCRSRTAWLSGALLIPALLSACFESPVETPEPKIMQETTVRVEQNLRNKLDMLFVIDDSPSMAPKQNELKARFPQLIQVLNNFAMQGNPAHYHIGVISTDLGSGPFTLGGNQCVPGGKGGKLQAVGAGAAGGCAGPQGANYIDFNQLNNTNNLPAGQDLETTFGCMASVGDRGCGFEQPLEAAYRALHDKPAENQGFLRDDAILVVVFVADEDDCSIDASSDLFDPTKTNQYGVLLSYRCNRFGIICGDPPMLMPYSATPGELANCRSATKAEGSKLTEVQKYINFFRQPAARGGVKTNPLDVVLVGITAPSTPVSTLLADPNPMPPGPYVACPMLDGTKCAVVVKHSCIAPMNTQFFGDPAVRINEVINAQPATNRQLTSICDTSYQAALQQLGELIVSALRPGCVDSPFQDPQNPDCLVEDITQNNDGSTTVKQLFNCAQSSPPCWRLRYDAECPAICVKSGDPGQQFGVQIDRGGGMAPPNTQARVACATLAVPKDANRMCGPSIMTTP